MPILRGAALLLAALLVLAAQPSHGLPPGFTDQLVGYMDEVLGFNFLPDGRVLLGWSLPLLLSFFPPSREDTADSRPSSTPPLLDRQAARSPGTNQ